jgi:hypothetical protein
MHLTFGVLVGAPRVPHTSGQAGKGDTIEIPDPAVKGYTSSWKLAAVLGRIMVSPDVVQRYPQESYQVLQVIEWEIAAGDHRFYSGGPGFETRTPE